MARKKAAADQAVATVEQTDDVSVTIEQVDDDAPETEAGESATEPDPEQQPEPDTPDPLEQPADEADANETCSDKQESETESETDAATDGTSESASSGENGPIRAWLQWNITINAEQYAALSHDQQVEANRWREQRVAGVSMPPPECLRPFAPKFEPPESEFPVQLACEFGSLSIGDEVASIGVTFNVDAMRLGQARDWLCGRRIYGAIGLGNGQMMLDGSEPGIVEAVFDSRKVTVGVKKFGTSLRMSLGEVDAAELAPFAKRKGRLRIDRVCLLESKDKSESSDDDDDESTAGEPHPDVAAGMHRPHGTPLLDAAAKAHQKQQREADDEPATIPLGDAEPLNRSVEQVMTSLLMVGCSYIPEAIIDTWSDEQRDEVVSWANAVHSCAYGRMNENDVPGFPVLIDRYLADEQRSDPVAFLKRLPSPGTGDVPTLEWCCLDCGYRQPIDTLFSDSGPVEPECPKCDESESIIVGYCQQHGTDDTGEIMCDATEFEVPLPSEVGCIIRTIDGRDGRWRVGSAWGEDGFAPATGLRPLRHDNPSHPSQAAAVAAELGFWIDEARKRKLDASIGKRLKEVLADVEKGTPLAEIEDAYGVE